MIFTNQAVIVREIPLEPFTPGRVQRPSSQHDDVIGKKRYLLKHNGTWLLGLATHAWYGWTFHIGSHSVQLNHIERLFEVDFSLLERE